MVILELEIRFIVAIFIFAQHTSFFFYPVLFVSTYYSMSFIIPLARNVFSLFCHLRMWQELFVDSCHLGPVVVNFLLHQMKEVVFFLPERGDRPVSDKISTT